MAIAVGLDRERAPGGYAQVDEAQHLIDEVAVVMQAFAGIGAHKSAMRALVVPRLVATARLHGREDVHQARMIAPLLHPLGNYVLLAYMGFADVLDAHPSSSGQLLRSHPHLVAKLKGKLRIIENADPACIEKPRHPLGVAGLWYRAADQDPVIARQNPSQVISVPLR